MIRVVIDTNVFISSFFGGNPRKVIDLWKRGKIILCLSSKIVDEYVEVLRRLGLAGEGELEELLSLLAEGFNNIFVASTPSLQVVRDDPDDDKFIECAVAAQARYIISGDNHLKAIGNYMGIKIYSPRDFLEEYGE